MYIYIFRLFLAILIITSESWQLHNIFLLNNLRWWELKVFIGILSAGESIVYFLLKLLFHWWFWTSPLFAHSAYSKLIYRLLFCAYFQIQNSFSWGNVFVLIKCIFLNLTFEWECLFFSSIKHSLIWNCFLDSWWMLRC